MNPFQLFLGAILVSALAALGFYVFGDAEIRDVIEQEAAKSLVKFLLGGALAALATLAIQLHLAAREENEKKRREEHALTDAKIRILQDSIGRLVGSANVLRSLAATETAGDAQKTRVLRCARLAEARDDLVRLKHELGNFGEPGQNKLVDDWASLEKQLRSLANTIKVIEVEIRGGKADELSRQLLEPDALGSLEESFFKPYGKTLELLRGQIAKLDGLQPKS